MFSILIPRDNSLQDNEPPLNEESLLDKQSDASLYRSAIHIYQMGDP